MVDKNFKLRFTDFDVGRKSFVGADNVGVGKITNQHVVRRGSNCGTCATGTSAVFDKLR